MGRFKEVNGANDIFKEDDPYDVDRMILIENMSIYANAATTNKSIRAYEEWNERMTIEHLLYKKHYSSTNKTEKIDRQIEKQVAILDNKRKKRLSDREAFLKAFYDDLYKDRPAVFTKKYRRACSETLLNKLEVYYRTTHGGQKGYSWMVFGDNRIHEPSEIAIEHICNFDTCNDVVPYGAFMFEGVKKEKYPFSWTDGFWYKVSLGNDHVFVQVKGEKKLITITGLITPGLDINVRDEVDI